CGVTVEPVAHGFDGWDCTVGERDAAYACAGEEVEAFEPQDTLLRLACTQAVTFSCHQVPTPAAM
ncbi:MAG: hypothetical protein ACRDP8_23785, partial [Actinopolymorphaceae bacterium]